jgi:hypothetical protein
MILSKYKRTGTFPIKNFKKPISSTRGRASKSETSVKKEESEAPDQETPLEKSQEL